MAGAEHIGRGMQQEPGAGNAQPIIGQGIQPERIQPVIGNVTENPQAVFERQVSRVQLPVQRRI